MIPSVPISWGELADKITILEIKAELLSSQSARENVKHELVRLVAIWEPIERENRNAAGLKVALKHANKTLWQIEDHIREKEAQKCFDDEFIALARAIYRTNDDRSRIKRQINTLLKSEIIEEKQYSAY
jgi:3-methyladenine DNA glycosylase/8-oxoguanine DNA glycosylase